MAKYRIIRSYDNLFALERFYVQKKFFYWWINLNRYDAYIDWHSSLDGAKSHLEWIISKIPNSLKKEVLLEKEI